MTSSTEKTDGAGDKPVTQQQFNEFKEEIKGIVKEALIPAKKEEPTQEEHKDKTPKSPDIKPPEKLFKVFRSRDRRRNIFVPINEEKKVAHAENISG